MPYKDPTKQKQAQQEHYQRKKVLIYERHKANVQEIRRLVLEAKDHPCQDCGVRYPYYVMQLDHRPGEDKWCNPSQLRTKGSLTKAKLELAKCDPVCANCHAERTYQRSL